MGSRVLTQGDLVDAAQFLVAEGEIFQRADVVEQLLRSGRAYQHGRDHAVVQQPGKRHLRERLAAVARDVVQFADLPQS